MTVPGFSSGDEGDVDKDSTYNSWACWRGYDY